MRRSFARISSLRGGKKGIYVAPHQPPVDLGHGVEANDTFYCWAHCTRQAGVEEAVDHVPAREGHG